MEEIKVIRASLFAAASLVAVAGNVFAQGPYVGASVFGDVVRSTHSEIFGASGATGGGEAIGFALRAGTRLGTIWGVDLEFARPALIEEDSRPGVTPLSVPTTLESFLLTLDPYVSRSSAVFPSFMTSLRTAERHTTLSAALWAEQQLSARVSLVYLGGVGFGRTEREFSVSYSPVLGSPLVVLPPYASTTVMYGVGAFVGFESRLALTDRARLVPAVRLHAIDNAWLVRPSVGINWSF
jgi:hypothetical protein